MTPRPWLMVVTLALGVLGCSTTQTFVGGLPIGQRVCVDAASGCNRFEDFARQTLDEQVPGHPDVLSVDIYAPDVRSESGERMMVSRSGGSDLVVVLRLADESAHAYWVQCGRGIDSDWCGLGPPSVVVDGIWTSP